MMYDIHTFYYSSAILIYSNPSCLALEDVIPTVRDRKKRKTLNNFMFRTGLISRKT